MLAINLSFRVIHLSAGVFFSVAIVTCIMVLCPFLPLSLATERCKLMCFEEHHALFMVPSQYCASGFGLVHGPAA